MSSIQRFFFRHVTVERFARLPSGRINGEVQFGGVGTHVGLLRGRLAARQFGLSSIAERDFAARDSRPDFDRSVSAWPLARTLWWS